MFNCTLSKIQHRGGDKEVATEINKITRSDTLDGITIYFGGTHERGHPETTHRLTLDLHNGRSLLDKLGLVLAGKP